jgi:hypothetical protein
MPRTRLAVERDCLDLWARHGFRVFERYDDVLVRAPQAPPGGYLVLEYVDAPKLVDHMRDARLALDERCATWRRFLAEWHRRHALAIAEREPRLVHENGDCKHVMLLPDEKLLWFDFEMVFRSRARVEEYVGHEIVQYLWQLLRQLDEDAQERVLAETAAHYPDRRLLRVGHDVFFRHPRWTQRVGRSLDRMRAKSKKPTSKYNVARKLRALL